MKKRNEVRAGILPSYQNTQMAGRTHTRSAIWRFGIDAHQTLTKSNWQCHKNQVCVCGSTKRVHMWGSHVFVRLPLT
jgi:hypothetical protein